MGCHLWAHRSVQAFHQEVCLENEPFMFRVFDYQEDVLKSFDQALDFIVDTCRNSSNYLPIKIEGYSTIGGGLLRSINVSYTWTHQMKGKIQFASNDDDQIELRDPSLTIVRLKDFYTRYPNGIICFG